MTIIIYGFFTIWGTEKRIKYREGANINDDSASAVLVDSVANIETVKYFHNEKLQSEKFSNSKQRWFNFAVQDNRVFASVYGGQELILYFGLGLILYVAVRQASVGIMSVGDLVLVSTYIVRLSAPLTSLGFIYGRFKNSFADIKAMATILDVKNTILEPNNPKKISKPKGAVEFKNVTFSYNNKRQIISALNFKILPGQRVAFVGPSGAGKSTIAKLIFRLYDVSNGKILLDGIDVRELANVERGKILAIVPQDPALFNDTISANIKFAKPQASDDEVIKATKSAQIDDFIKTLPQQYDTMVGERGVKISGGERQRVAIARAMICNPKILVFDEATSSLDSHSEQKVLGTINQVAQGRTSISIAHRLSTIVNSDIIFVLKGGKIVEQGTHLELLKQSGVYAKLWAIQTHKNF